MTSASRSDLRRSDELIASATSADLRQARALLDADPALARHDLACACVTGEADKARPAAAGANPNTAFINDDAWLQVALYGAAGIDGNYELTQMLLDTSSTQPTSGTVTTATKSSTTRVSSPTPPARAS